MTKTFALVNGTRNNLLKMSFLNGEALFFRAVALLLCILLLGCSAV